MALGDLSYRRPPTTPNELVEASSQGTSMSSEAWLMGGQNDFRRVAFFPGVLDLSYDFCVRLARLLYSVAIGRSGESAGHWDFLVLELQ